jgi:hypothetical protein
MRKALDPWRACVRLWVIGSVAWIGFWTWRYVSGCFEAKNGVLWCPNASGDSITSTSYIHLALKMLGLPASGLIVGLLLLWFAKGTRTNRSSS